MNRSICQSAIVALAWFTLLAPVAPAQTAPAKKVVTIEGITEYKLDNGARILLFPDPAASTVTINMTVLVGSRHEGYGESGMAHLLEHMCFKGTPTFPNVDKVLQEHGANNTANGTTWLDRTNYYETMPGTDKNLEFGIKLKADILVNSNIKKEDLDKEWTVVRSEFERNENTPEIILSQRLTAAAFEWHNYGKTTMGNRVDVEKVPIENLRAFYRKYYQPDNIVLTIAGKFDEKKALAYAEQYFGALKRPSRLLQETYTEEPAQDGERTVILRRVGKVPVVGVAYHVPGTAHPDFAILDVLTNVLTAEPSGRLYKALVEQKKATNVAAFVQSTHDPYLLEVYATVAPGVKPEEVRDIITQVMEKLGTDKVSKEEVDRAKRKMAADRDRSLTKSDAIALELSEWLGAGDWRLLFIHRDRVAKVTVKAVQEVAGKYFKRSNRTAGLYLPTEAPERTPVPEVPNIAKLVKDYKGGAAIALGEKFDPTPENLEKRTKRSTLPGGMKVALLPKKTRGEMVVGAIVLRYGNEQALLGKTRASAFLGPLMMRGTTKYTYEQLQDELDLLGATLSAGGASGSLTFSLECKRDKLPEVLKLMQELMRNPIFPESELEILKRESRQSLEKGLTDPQALASNALQRKLNPYPKDSIHYVPTIAESIERLDKVTRTDIVNIYNSQLGATVGEVVFVGDFDEQAAMKQVEEMLKGWKSKTAYERIPSVVKLDVAGGKEKIETPDKENAVYVAGYQIAMDDSDNDYPALVMANYVLGQSAFNSRIVDRLRTKEGLSYGAGSTFRAGSQDKAGSFGLYAICNPSNMTKLEKSMQEILTVFAKKGITEGELKEGVKGWLQERKVARSSDSSILGQLISQAYLGRTYQRSIEFEKQIMALTVEQVNAAIGRHFDPSRFYIVEAGDFAKKK
jgi:zinc protease